MLKHVRRPAAAVRQSAGRKSPCGVPTAHPMQENNSLRMVQIWNHDDLACRLLCYPASRAVRCTWNALVEVAVEVAAQQQGGAAFAVALQICEEGVSLREHRCDVHGPDVRRPRVVEQMRVQYAQAVLCGGQTAARFMVFRLRVQFSSWHLMHLVLVH